MSHQEELTRLQKAVVAARTKPGTILKLKTGLDGRGSDVFKFYRVMSDYSLQEYGLAASAFSRSRQATSLTKAKSDALDREGASPLAKTMAAQSSIFEPTGYGGSVHLTKETLEQALAERRARVAKEQEAPAPRINPNVIHR